MLTIESFDKGKPDEGSGRKAKSLIFTLTNLDSLASENDNQLKYDKSVFQCKHRLPLSGKE